MAKRRRKISRRQEDYLEAVLTLLQETGAARVRDIAARTGVSAPSVTAALKHLAEAGLVDYDPYELVQLTPDGRAVAEKVRGRHDALSDFLVNVLRVDAETADANACRMEHVVDDRVLGRLGLLAEFLRQRPAGGRDWTERFAEFCRGREARKQV